MSRYRKVEVRMYGDEKFRRLSAAPPSGQGLWLYLITGPHTNSIPGLSRVGRAALAEELGWSIEDFDKAFAEVFREGMAKADWEHRVVWIPNAIKHNKPENPNVVTSWRAELELIPECDLKEEAMQYLAVALSAISPAFAGAFEALGHSAKPLAKGMAKGIAKPLAKGMANQEQEQEQEQKKQKQPSSGFVLPSWIDTSAWQGFEDMRRKERHPLTDRARTLAISKLEDLKIVGNDSTQVLNQSTLNGWRDLFPITVANRNGGFSATQAPVIELPRISTADKARAQHERKSA